MPSLPVEIRAGALAYTLPMLAGRRGVRHAFSTRHGGVPAGGRLARKRLLQGGGFSPDTRIVTLHQVHGADVLSVMSPVTPPGDPPAADAAVTDVAGTLLVVQTADCAAILLADATAGVVAAAHAGWRGAVAGIVAGTLDSMQQMGASPSRVLAAIGPSLGPCCFEVGEEVAEQFDAIDRSLVDRSRRRPHVDLPAAVTLLLARSGVPESAIERADACTACRQDLFFSHRGERGRSGRMLASIARTDGRAVVSSTLAHRTSR